LGKNRALQKKRIPFNKEKREIITDRMRYCPASSWTLLKEKRRRMDDVNIFISILPIPNNPDQLKLETGLRAPRQDP
jgi:hypothetical protein